MLKIAMMRMRVVVAMVRVRRGHGLFAMMTEDRRIQSHEADAVLLQCCTEQGR